MGFMDALLGRRKTKAAAPDRLFAITTAYVTLEAQHGIVTQGAAAIVFQPLPTGDFQQIVADVEETVRATGQETGTGVETRDDEFSYRWMILRDPDPEDLAVGVNAVSDALAIGGYKDRVLCAVFSFHDAGGKPLYLIYNYKRGSWYPFVPAPGDKERSTERELQIKAIIGPELPIEPELDRWFPLWGIPI
jgi:PspA associated protein B